MEKPLHPPQPKKYPSVVYKYRDWKNDYHKRTLLNHELFLSSPQHFNDPFDCKIPIAYWKLAKDPKLAYEYFPQAVESHYPNISQAEHIKKVENLIKDKRFEDKKWIEEDENKFYKFITKNFGVISLTEFNDDIRMWSHYANSHTGFCIGFKSDKLFFSDDMRFGQVGKVDYVNDYPIILPTEDHFIKIRKVLYTKFDIWEYEQEYRLTKIFEANSVVKFKPEEVAEIIIGCSTSKQDTESIVNICRCNFPEIPVYKANTERLNFKLTFKQII